MKTLDVWEHSVNNLTRNPDLSIDRHYRATIRRFASGRREVSVRRIEGLQHKRNSDSLAYGGLVSYRDKQPLTDAEIQEREDQNARRAVYRAKQKIRWAVKSIDADHLLTLTYRANPENPMNDIDRLKADWDRFLRYVKNGLPASERYGRHAGLKEWRFVACRERTEAGTYHLHVAVVGRQDIGFLRRCWYLAAGGSQDDTGADTIGQVDIRGPKKRWGTQQNDWGPNKLAGYMTKYLHKVLEDVQEKKGAKRYWVSRHNDREEVVKVWLGAADFGAAIKEAHALFCTERSGPCLALYAARDYSSIWLAG